MFWRNLHTTVTILGLTAAATPWAFTNTTMGKPCIKAADMLETRLKHEESMRRFVVFLLIQTIAVTASAQPTPPTRPSPTLSSATTPGVTDDGKIKLGLEGRGNYRKPRKPREVGTATNTPAGGGSSFQQAMQAQRAGGTPTNTPNSVTPSPARANPPLQENALRNDSALMIPPTSPASAPRPNSANPSAPVIANALPALD